MDGPFEFVEGLDRYQGLCVEGNGTIDWCKLMAYKRQVLAPFPQMMPAMFEAAGIEFVPEFGRLVDAHTVQAGERTLETEYIVIGTGQRDSVLDIPGNELMHNSREFLDIDEMPEHLVCIGAGIIGMEFASMALVLGKKVTFVEFAPRALAAYPEAYVATLVEKMTAQGTDFHFGEPASSVEKTPNGYRLVCASGLAVEGDYVLCCAGRVANAEGLGLEGLGIEASRRGIVVDDHLRTSVPTILASGDVVDKSIPRLAPTAAFESEYIARQILGDDSPICYPPVPNLVFTLPRIAQVGVTLGEARANPDAYRVDEWHYGPQNEWVDNRELDIDVSLVLDNDGHLVGAAIIGAEAGTWIDFLTLVINTNLTGAELSKMIFAFPTQTYMFADHLAKTLVAALIFVTTGVSIEAWLAAGILLLLIKSGLEQLREAISEILGERPEADVARSMRQAIASVDGVEGVYDLLVADYGPDRIMASCHVEVPDTMDASSVDLLLRKVAERVYAEHRVVMTAVGIYSRNTADDEAEAMRRRVADCVRAYEHVVEMHGFYVDFAEKVMRFDLVIDFEVRGRVAYFDRVLSAAHELYPEFQLVTTMDADYTD